jgi:hypothetical protein
VKSGDKPAAPEVATFEIRRDESKPIEPDKKEKSDRDGSLLNPIAKIRPPKKEIDLTGAETIIQDGVIVGGTDPLAAAVQTGTTAPRQAPQVVNGVTRSSRASAEVKTLAFPPIADNIALPGREPEGS